MPRYFTTIEAHNCNNFKHYCITLILGVTPSYLCYAKLALKQISNSYSIGGRVGDCILDVCWPCRI